MRMFTWWRVVVLALLVSASCAVQAEDLRESLRGPVFGAANTALEGANAAKASVLAPTTYAKAAEAYRRAEKEFEAGGKLERIRSLLEQAQSGFDAARSAAQKAATEVAAAYEARLDAEASGAEEFANKLWKEGETAFYDAVTTLEKNSTRRVARNAGNAEAAYRAAELEAIDTSVMAETDRVIAQAADEGARRYAPLSYQFAVDLLNQARTELAQNRYDTDKPRNLASSSLHYAKHARYVTKVVKQIQDRDESVESVLMEWENQINRLADELDLAVFYDNGPDLAIDTLAASIKSLVQERDELRVRMADSNAQIELLTSELGGQNAARERLNQQLAQQQRKAERIRRIEALFKDDEAQVLRVEDRIVIRMIGLNFDSGSSNVLTRHYPLLTTLIEALGQFPESPLIIEGHTDSHGADDLNHRLSTARADAVASYLIANSAISPALVSALGFGETKPVANNETVEGRRKNRRIDVVIYPSM
ncbi:MAG: OmpA family protein [Pseudomonadales bacterium]|nr:OmpA family protein [Pseudomonadales bacterium]